MQPWDYEDWKDVKFKDTASKNIESKIDSKENGNKSEIEFAFSIENIEYVYEIRKESIFATAMWDKLNANTIIKKEGAESLSISTIPKRKYTFNIKPIESYGNKRNSLANRLFILERSDKEKIFYNDEMYYKITQMDRPAHEIIKELFALKRAQLKENENAKRVIKSYINEFLSKQNLALEIIDSVEIDYDIYLSVRILWILSNFMESGFSRKKEYYSMPLKDLEKIFNDKVPEALKQNAKYIIESKIKELEKRKDSINTKIESIKLNADFEAFLNHKGAAMLKELEP